MPSSTSFETLETRRLLTFPFKLTNFEMPDGAFGQAAVGDFNGDGFNDVAVVNRHDGVDIVFGAHDGTLGPDVGGIGADNPYGIVSADFDHDGRDDIALLDIHSALRMFHAESDGTFTATGKFGLTNAVALVAGDFNGDGNADLAVAAQENNGNSACVLFNDGAGQFQTRRRIVGLPGSHGIAAADLNGDGLDDLTLTNADESLSFLLSKSRMRFFPRHDSEAFDGFALITAGNFDATPGEDLLLRKRNSNSDPDRILLLRAQPDGRKLRGISNTETLAVTRGIAAGDFDANGNTDLTIEVAGSGSIQFDHAGSFDGVDNYNIPVDPDYTAPVDFNHDGFADILWISQAGTGGRITIAYNDSPGASAPNV